MAIMEIAETAGTFGVMLGLIEVIKTLMKRKQNGKAMLVRCVNEPLKAAIYKTKTDVEWLRDVHEPKHDGTYVWYFPPRLEKMLEQLVTTSADTQRAHLESKAATNELTKTMANLVSTTEGLLLAIGAVIKEKDG